MENIFRQPYTKGQFLMDAGIAQRKPPLHRTDQKMILDNSIHNTHRKLRVMGIGVKFTLKVSTQSANVHCMGCLQKGTKSGLFCK
ncbi:MAG: hypothetical protein MZU91_10210 [Desulfosudis oleivorans]|nr:hypothetical protein [Desulfosudis oleivorans]